MKKAIITVVITIMLFGGSLLASADIVTWHYEDDFNTRKAENDCYSHSSFRPEVLNVPPFPQQEPVLYYAFWYNRWYHEPLDVLLFMGDASLTYAFPLDSQLARVDSGTILVGIPMSCPICMVLIPSGLFYQLSEDGINWTNPSELLEGGARISLLPSNNSFTYIRFFGHEAMLARLSVTVTGPEIIEADISIDPNTLNLASKGNWLTCYIWLPEDYNVADIDPNSVFLEDIVAAERFEINDDAAIVKFSRSEVQNILNIGENEITVTGELLDGTIFEGTDIISVIDKGGKKK